MQSLFRLVKKKEKLVVGLMSGTSADGIDCALVKIKNSGFNTKVELINFVTVPYSDQLKKQILDISHPGQGTVNEICLMNFALAEFYVDAIFKLCELSNIDVKEIDLIGSHGQTIHHLPDPHSFLNKKIRSTFQIGEASVIANRTGTITVSNFRSADLADGGQGAPLIPYFDYLIFNSKKKNRVILNIGGIANITVLPKNISVDQVIAFDTGPGNMVINALMEKFFKQDYDQNGRYASEGEISKKLLDYLMSHPYFDKPYPKSTGREDFGKIFIDELLEESQKLKIEKKDIIATVTDFTASSIVEGIKISGLNGADLDQLIVSGGGAHNTKIMDWLRIKLEHVAILTSDHFGIPVDAKEAICFAVLANETISGNSTNIPSVTGAKNKRILGTISLV